MLPKSDRNTPLPAVPYRTLFLLKADSAFIFEIKRLDVQSSNPGDVYFWFYFDKATQALQPLTFVSMNAEGGEQQRAFVQGQLKFGPEQGVYAAHGASFHLKLRTVVSAALPAEVDAAVQAYFRPA
ncbi:hypothetical protein [Hymenobacter psychrotolerans]|uniref:Uncharacterized protein n=1 Tax=Hymenobacter psychrotolerans DSM 18569 TaxID=1121959 RepID=A0A1M6W9S7_9BACT|nr:hypothetical protein [Hymenobacter psychrotolerans]SHK90513.1 hypothetical protein SAMN02746009_01789 [Hymenobacter psychrotolerans DSM 18569]